MIESAPWERLPTYEDMQRVFPRGVHVTGLVRLVCKTDDKGAMTDCQVVDDTPAGQGFGAAALRLTSVFRVKTRMCDGRPTAGAKVTIPIRFTPPPQ